MACVHQVMLEDERSHPPMESALLDTCMTAEFLLENDEWLEDALEFFVHDLEGSIQLVEWEGMCRHERGIDALHLKDAEEALHTQPSTGA